MKQLKSFVLADYIPKRTFNCQYPFSGIKIKRIVVPYVSTRPESEWSGLLYGLSLLFKSTATDGITKSFSIALIGQLSSNHRHPIFDFDFFVPEDNENNLQALSPFFNKFEIELLNELNNTNLAVTVFFEEYPIIAEV